MKRTGAFVGIVAVVLALALLVPSVTNPVKTGAQSDIYAMVQLPKKTAAEVLKPVVDDVFDTTGCGKTYYAIIGCTKAQLDSLVASSYTVIEQRTGDEEECLDYLYELRDKLVPPSRVHHTVLGPDPFGYYAIDSKAGRIGPAYNWLEIRNTGTRLTEATVRGNMDDGYWYLPIGFPFRFPFRFYGQTFNQCSIGTNGNLCFQNSYLGLSNCCIPCKPTYPVRKNFIAVLWDDLSPGCCGVGQVYYQTLLDKTAGRRMFVVEFYDVPRCCCSPSGATFEVILYQGSNEILMQYQDVDFDWKHYNWGNGATVGIQKDSRTGLLYSCNQPQLTNGLAILFTPWRPGTSPLLFGDEDSLYSPPLGPR